jgi:hypothetical protein
MNYREYFKHLKNPFVQAGIVTCLILYFLPSLLWYAVLGSAAYLGYKHVVKPYWLSKNRSSTSNPYRYNQKNVDKQVKEALRKFR